MQSSKTDAARIGRHVVILCHPDPSSFNHAIAKTYCDAVRANGHEVVFRDLYAMGFDPVLKAAERPGVGFVMSADVASELSIIAGGDVFVLVYPIWYGSQPAMLKGYVERVLGSGVEPDDVRHQTRGALLGDKRLLSFTTAATTSIWLDQEGQIEGLRSVFDQYLVHAFGMHAQTHVRFSHITSALTEHFAGGYLLEVKERAQKLCAEIAYGDDALLHDSSLARSFSR